MTFFKTHQTGSIYSTPGKQILLKSIHTVKNASRPGTALTSEYYRSIYYQIYEPNKVEEIYKQFMESINRTWIKVIGIRKLQQLGLGDKKKKLLVVNGKSKEIINEAKNNHIDLIVLGFKEGKHILANNNIVLASNNCEEVISFIKQSMQNSRPNSQGSVEASGTIQQQTTTRIIEDKSQKSYSRLEPMSSLSNDLLAQNTKYMKAAKMPIMETIIEKENQDSCKPIKRNKKEVEHKQTIKDQQREEINKRSIKLQNSSTKVLPCQHKITQGEEKSEIRLRLISKQSIMGEDLPKGWEKYGQIPKVENENIPHLHATKGLPSRTIRHLQQQQSSSIVQFDSTLAKRSLKASEDWMLGRLGKCNRIQEEKQTN